MIYWLRNLFQFSLNLFCFKRSLFRFNLSLFFSKEAYFDSALEEGVIPLCAALAAHEHGDARRALDLLRVSGELADREDSSAVKELHVKLAQAKIETDSMSECVSTLPTQSKVILYCMLILDQMGLNIFTSGEVIRIYKKVAPKMELDVLTSRRITDLISELNMLGVINTRVVSRGRYGRTKEMWFDGNSQKIMDVIMSDMRLSHHELSEPDLAELRSLLRWKNGQNWPLNP